MNVLVTGTSRGIGLAIAQKFLAEGHRVWGVDLLPGAIEHPAYAHVQGDIREVTANVPDLAVLVNNAGTLEEADAIDVNLMGTMAFTERHLDSPSLKSVLSSWPPPPPGTGPSFPDTQPARRAWWDI